MINYLTLTIALFIINILVALKSVHIMQLNSYNVDQQLLWYKQHKNDFLPNVLLFILSILWLLLSYNIFSIVIYMGIIIDLLVLLIEYFPRKQKKPLVWTKRVIRLFILMVVLFMMLLIPFILYKDNNALTLYLFITALAPMVCLVAFLIMTPIENGIRKKYAKEATKILKQNNDLYTIGITGSFGKTSVKYYLSTILKSKYNVCFTKGSFNTPMGATLTIKNDLKSYDEIFVCEMGARRVGDIKEMCDIVLPKAAIITEVADQHLDTFKNIDNVLKTKLELADYVVGNDITTYNRFNKIILVNGDNQIIKDYIGNKYADYITGNNKTIYTFGFNKDNDYNVEVLDIDHHGTSFRFIDNVNNQKYDFKTILVGRHNVLNLCSAIAMATLLEVNIDDIRYSIEKIVPVAHRLEIKRITDNQIIIDDAYNANIKGSKYALEVMSYFKDYKKVLITPGIVELGDKQYELNKQFAIDATKVCDYILVVANANKKALLDGLKESNYSEYNYFHFDSFNEAYSYANINIKDEKKVILIENDLPDNY